MRRARGAQAPVLLRFPPESGRVEGWGRLEELCAASAVVSTQTRLSRHERVLLSFVLADERFRDLPAEVVWVESDGDGFVSAEVRLRDEVERRRLAKTLLELLSR
ncbi:MAG: hypothetical protein HY077_06670 [Elusimicrobia bacterium]|nr:hypothetical protein [Elusimicrobiota bacterium]